MCLLKQQVATWYTKPHTALFSVISLLLLLMISVLITSSVSFAAQRLTGVLVHLVNRMTADIRRALWWQERTAKHRYLLRLAAENQKQQRQAELAQNRYQAFPAPWL